MKIPQTISPITSLTGAMQRKAYSNPCWTVEESKRPDLSETFRLKGGITVSVALRFENGDIPAGGRYLFEKRWRWHAQVFFWEPSVTDPYPVCEWKAGWQEIAGGMILDALAGVGASGVENVAFATVLAMHAFKVATGNEIRGVKQPSQLIVLE